MRYLLTADELGAEEALRIGLVQAVTTKDKVLDEAIAIAERIAAQAPLGVQATLRPRAPPATKANKRQPKR